MERRVYKVVLLDPSSGLRASALVWGLAEVKYRPDCWAMTPEWLQEKGYYLCAFDGWKSAWKFVCGNVSWGWEIWEAEARSVLEELPPRCSQVHLAEGELIETSEAWPPGTVMARELRLIRCVWNSFFEDLKDDGTSR